MQKEKRNLTILGLIAAAVVSYLTYRGYVSPDQTKQIDVGVKAVTNAAQGTPEQPSENP